MPVGKKIYNQISKKAGERKARYEKVVEKRINSGDKPPVPPTVKQADKNVTSITSSNSLHITEMAKTPPLQISPNEGMPAVNGKSGAEVVAKAVTPIRSKVKSVDPTAGAIKSVGKDKNKSAGSHKSAPRLCSTCNKQGHTKGDCSSNL